MGSVQGTSQAGEAPRGELEEVLTVQVTWFFPQGHLLHQNTHLKKWASLVPKSY